MVRPGTVCTCDAVQYDTTDGMESQDLSTMPSDPPRPGYRSAPEGSGTEHRVWRRILRFDVPLLPDVAHILESRLAVHANLCRVSSHFAPCDWVPTRGRMPRIGVCIARPDSWQSVRLHYLREPQQPERPVPTAPGLCGIPSPAHDPGLD